MCSCLTSTHYIPTYPHTDKTSQSASACVSRSPTYIATHCSSLSIPSSFLTYTLALPHWSTGWAADQVANTPTPSPSPPPPISHPIHPSLFSPSIPVFPSNPHQGSPGHKQYKRSASAKKKKKRSCLPASACLHLLHHPLLHLRNSASASCISKARPPPPKEGRLNSI